MRKILVALVTFLFATLATANPFVQATVAAGTAQCGFYLDSGAVVVVAAAGTTCQFDLGSVAVGAHVVAADARTAADPIWGSQTSAKSANLNFTRPAAPAVPTGLVLAP